MTADPDLLSCLESGILRSNQNDVLPKYPQEPSLQLAISALSLDSKNFFISRLLGLDSNTKSTNCDDLYSNKEIVYVMRLLQNNNNNNLQTWDHVAAVHANKSKFEIGENGVIILTFRESIPIFLKEKSEDFFLTQNVSFMLEIAFAIQVHMDDKPKLIGFGATQLKSIELYGKRLTLPLFTIEKKHQGFVFANVGLKGVKWREMDDDEILDYSKKDILPVVEDSDGNELSMFLFQHAEYLNKCIENIGENKFNRSRILPNFLFNKDGFENTLNDNVIKMPNSNDFSDRSLHTILNDKSPTSKSACESYSPVNRLRRPESGDKFGESPTSSIKDFLENYDKSKQACESDAYSSETNLDNLVFKNYYSMGELMDVSKDPDIDFSLNRSQTLSPLRVEISAINNMLDLKQMQRKLFSKRVENFLMSTEYEKGLDGNCNTNVGLNDNNYIGKDSCWVDHVDRLLKRAEERLSICFDTQLVSFGP